MKKSLKPRTERSLTDFLKKVPFLAGVDEVTILELANASKVFHYDKGDVLCKAEQFANGVHVIEYGTVSEIAIDWNGFNINVKTGGRCDAFGELGVLLENGYLTTVIAETACQVIFIPKETFSKVIWSNQSAIKEILKMLSLRLQKSAQKTISYTLFNAEGRMAYVLSIMNRERRDARYVMTTQEDLSQKCGIARQTVSSILNRWQKDSIIALKRGRIEVLNEDLLEELAINSAKHS